MWQGPGLDIPLSTRALGSSVSDDEVGVDDRRQRKQGRACPAATAHARASRESLPVPNARGAGSWARTTTRVGYQPRRAEKGEWLGEFDDAHGLDTSTSPWSRRVVRSEHQEAMVWTPGWSRRTSSRQHGEREIGSNLFLNDFGGWIAQHK
jgi:hypothetical protein